MEKRKMQNNILKRKTKRTNILRKMVRQSAAVIFTAGYNFFSFGSDFERQRILIMI
jgi:hypothetical protein